MSEKILQTYDLTVGYRERRQKANAIQSLLNLTLSSHQITALIGPNGAGKSTLLRTLCGLQEPLAGRITIQGEALDQLTIENKAKAISVVLTHTVESNMLTVKEVVAIGRQPYTNWLGSLDSTNETIIENVLSTVNIQHLEKRRLSQLSDGERQRVWIAKALAQDTPLICLDEPTSHLDYKNRIEIFQLLKQLSQTGKSILISTHELDLAMRFADQLWVMHQGITVGTPEEIEKEGVLADVLGFSQDTRHVSF